MLYSTDFMNRCVTLCHIPVLAVSSDVIFVYYNIQHDIILAANSAGTSQLQGLGFDPGIPGTGSGFSVSLVQWLLKVNERIPLGGPNISAFNYYMSSSSITWHALLLSIFLNMVCFLIENSGGQTRQSC